MAALAIGAVTGGTGSGSGPTPGALPALSFPAPPHAAAQQQPCTRLLTRLPVQLGKLTPRVVHSPSPFVIAWGEPPVVLRCGVDRPASLHAGSTAQYFTNGPQSGPYYDVTSTGGANVWTTVDRGPYVSITVPAKYQGADVLPPLSQAIAAALPAVCSTADTAPLEHRCTRRA